MFRTLVPLLLCLGLFGWPGSLAAQAKSKAKTKPQEQVAPAEAAAMRAKLLEDYFGVCDLDNSSWISFREASATMGITKSDFRALDDDNDGRFSFTEFKDHGQQVLELLGSFREVLPAKANQQPAAPEASKINPGALLQTLGSVPTQPSTGALGLRQLLAGSSEPEALSKAMQRPNPRELDARLPAIPYPNPTEMLSLFDLDGSGGLSRQEVKRVISRIQAKLSADVIVDRTDRSRNGELEQSELGPLAYIISRRLSTQGFLNLQNPGGTGASKLSWTPNQSNPSAPMNGLKGTEQFSHFHLLDSDGSGEIDSADLRHKLTQSHSSVRSSAIISALDLDGNGSIDPKEFLVAMRGSN